MQKEKQNKKEDEPLFIVIDLFCGAGGTSCGFEQAMYVDEHGVLRKLAKIIACVNHDPKAIKSHWRNHPEVKHFEEDIRTLSKHLDGLKRLVDYWRAKYPNAYLILWASLECTNFSKAKGGQAREADSRTLAESLHMQWNKRKKKYEPGDSYIQILKPDFIQIENVVEFMSWGEMNEHGKPVSKKNGRDWLRWREKMCEFGYIDDWREMNSANYGAYTSRNRLFGVFARPWLPITYPVPTHAKAPEKSPMYADLQKWKAVKDVLDFKDIGKSIFNRKKALSDRTLERILAGLIKYVAHGDKSFLMKYFSGRPKGKVNSIEGPAPTITTFGGTTLVQPISILKYNSVNKKNGKHVPPSLDDPAPTITGRSIGLIQGEFLDIIYGHGYPSSIDDPAPTVRTKDGIAKVRAEYFIDKHFGTNAQNQSIDQPAGSIMPNDKHRLIEAFIMPTNFDNKPTSIEEPLQTITANRKHHYAVTTFIENPSHGGNCTSIDNPAPVVVARQDKAPLRLIQAEHGKVAIPIYDDDSEVMIKIKCFMAMYGLVDIKMRMLRVHELLDIQGFPKGYVLEGNQSDKKKFIGNSVVPSIVKYWSEAMASRLINDGQKLAV